MNLKGAKENPWRKSRAEQKPLGTICQKCKTKTKKPNPKPNPAAIIYYTLPRVTCGETLGGDGKWDVCVENGLRISAYKILFQWQSQLQDKQTSHSAKKTISLALLLSPFKPSRCFTVACFYCLLCFTFFFCFTFYFFFLSSGDFFEFIFLAITFGICTLIKF